MKTTLPPLEQDVQSKSEKIKYEKRLSDKKQINNQFL